MGALNFTCVEMQDLFKLLAVLLKLGNVVFRACINVDGSIGCRLDNEIGKHIQNVLIFELFVSCFQNILIFL